MFKLCVMMLVVFVLGGCAGPTPPGLYTEEAEEVIAFGPARSMEYTLLIECPNYILGKFEPPRGIYTGAYILSNPRVNFDIGEFEARVGPHAIYRYNMMLGDPFPMQWVLSCIAHRSTPYIAIDIDNFFDITLLENTAKEFAQFQIPMFVEFAKVRPTFNAYAYVAYFRQAREIFRRIAPHVAFVWAVELEDAFDAAAFYPGDDALDWVSIHMLQTLHSRPMRPGRQTSPYPYDVLNALRSFYLTFHRQKPIFVHVGVSHFSTYDYVYRMAEATEELKRIYSTIIGEFPRVKGIIYLDYNAVISSRNQSIRDDFSVSSEVALAKVYRSIIEGENFLTRINTTSAGRQNTELFKSPVSVLRVDDAFYFPEYAFGKVLQINEARGTPTYLNGKYFLPLDILQSQGLGIISIDEPNNRIIFHR